jgi:hypothetical protein
VRIIYIDKYAESANHPRDDFRRVLITSFVANFSIFVTAIPFLKPIMDGLHTGILASDLRSMGGASFLRSSSYALGSRGKFTQGTSKDHPGMWTRTKGKESGHTTTAVSGKARSNSAASDERMVIQQSTVVSVEHGDAMFIRQV